MTRGDLRRSSTISGPEPYQHGSLLELSWGGDEPIDIGEGQTRSFLEDGDTVTLHDAAHGEDYMIGFGTCTAIIKPAIKFS